MPKHNPAMYSAQITLGDLIQVGIMLVSITLIYAQLRQEIALLKLSMTHIRERLTAIEAACAIRHPLKATKLLATLTSCVLLAGCASFVPSERRSQATQATATQLAQSTALETTRQLNNTPPPITVGTAGSNSPVTIHVLPLTTRSTAKTTTSLNDQGDTTTVEALAVSIPLGVKLLLLALGIGALLVVWWIIRRSSAAAAMAYASADTVLASLIDRATDRASVATDPNQIAAELAHRAEVEKARGKLARKTPA